MDQGGSKCVMVIDEYLPSGLAVNAAGVLAFSLGRELDGVVGHNVVDGSGNLHAGITRIPIPILKADAGVVREIRERAEAHEELFVVDFPEVAQTAKTYDEYEDAISGLKSEDIRYLGLALYGNKKPVDKLTGSLALLR